MSARNQQDDLQTTTSRLYGEGKLSVALQRQLEAGGFGVSASRELLAPIRFVSFYLRPLGEAQRDQRRGAHIATAGQNQEWDAKAKGIMDPFRSNFEVAKVDAAPQPQLWLTEIVERDPARLHDKCFCLGPVSQHPVLRDLSTGCWIDTCGDGACTGDLPLGEADITGLKNFWTWLKTRTSCDNLAVYRIHAPGFEWTDTKTGRQHAGSILLVIDCSDIPVNKGAWWGRTIGDVLVRLAQQLIAVEHSTVTLWKSVPDFGMIGSSQGIRRVRDVVARILEASSSPNVLILGESGVGKELVAKALHFSSTRRSGPFVPVNCGALPETLLESELFGHEKGAFTGADRRRVGHIEAANSGTIFFDEIGEMPLTLQVKLLRVLEERRVKKLGSNSGTPLDVHVIAATNRDIGNARRKGDFRDDLYFRLSVITIEVPPLRERKEDLEPLVEHFVRGLTRNRDRNVVVPTTVLDGLRRYHWPGNVRELRNAIERALVLSTGTVELADFGLPLERHGASRSLKYDAGMDDEAAKAVFLEALTQADKSTSNAKDRTEEACRLLGLAKRTYYKVMADRPEIQNTIDRRFGISPKSPRNRNRNKAT